MTEKKKCATCKKKLTIANKFICECGVHVCWAHRDPDDHDCTSQKEMKQKAQEELEKKLEKTNTNKNLDKM